MCRELIGESSQEEHLEEAEESRIGHSGKLNCDVLALEAFAYPTCRSGAGIANQSCLQQRQGGCAFIPPHLTVTGCGLSPEKEYIMLGK